MSKYLGKGRLVFEEYKEELQKMACDRYKALSEKLKNKNGSLVETDTRICPNKNKTKEYGKQWRQNMLEEDKQKRKNT